jgi:hypothetical protein
MAYSGARGTLIYEKNLKSKISCQTPFKILFPFHLATGLLIGIVSTNRQSGDKMLFLALTLPIY